MVIPECLSHLPRWGEFPIPFTVPDAPPGERPDFRAISPKKHNLCVRYQLCGACGKHIPKPPYWFHLGPMCVQNAEVFAQPFHRDCAIAALTMCPWLSLGQRARHGAIEGRSADIIPAARQHLPPKPTRIALAAIEHYHTLLPSSDVAAAAQLYVSLPPAGSYPIEWWSYQDGLLRPEAA